MKRVWIGFCLLMLAISANAAVTVRDGYFWFNGVRQKQVWGIDAFKLGNIVGYHYTGQGGGHADPERGKYSLGYALEYVQWAKGLFGDTTPVLRVFWETGGWKCCEDDVEDGIPRGGMFGSEPSDQGCWDRARLRDGNRETEVHRVCAKTLEWFFATSQAEGVAFEIVIDATLKHDDIPKGEIDHVIRQSLILAEELQNQYPQALIIMNGRNEIFAHNKAGHTLAEINMWAVRRARDDYWKDGVFIVDQAEARFDYDVGPERDKFDAGLIHPPRDEGWEQWPTAQDAEQMRTDSRGMPWGANESMMFCEPERASTCRAWYGTGGWTSDWTKYRQFLSRVKDSPVKYFVIHAEKYMQCDPLWPYPKTRVDRWIADTFGGTVGELPEPEPPPPSVEPTLHYDPIINGVYQLVLARAADGPGLEVYNDYMAECVPEFGLPTCIDQLQTVLFESEEYQRKNTH